MIEDIYFMKIVMRAIFSRTTLVHPKAKIIVKKIVFLPQLKIYFLSRDFKTDFITLNFQKLELFKDIKIRKNVFSHH